MHLILAATLAGRLLSSDIGKSIIGFTLLAILFGLLETIWPEDRQHRKLRKGYFTDVLYFFAIIPLARVISTIGIVIAFVLLVRWLPHTGFAAIQAQPLWLQGIEILLVGDVLGYWSHRAFHKLPALWPYHAVHHSSEHLDWLAAARVHPVDTLITKVFVTIPFFFIGFSANALTTYVLFLALYPIYLHANVPWSYGPFRYVIASPAFHRWHHTAEQEGLDKNLAGLFPFVDIIFGSLYFPQRASKVYGLYGEHMSNNIFAQMWYPFRRKQRVIGN